MGKRKAEPGAKAEEEQSDDYCAVCDAGGDLVCCDGCPKVYHPKCIGKTVEDLPDLWFCPECMVPPDDLAWTGAPTADNAASDEDDSSVTQVIKGIGKRRKAQKKPAIKKKLSDTPRCLVCGQHGSLLECSTCAKTYHEFCLQAQQPSEDAPGDSTAMNVSTASEDTWTCPTCRRSPSLKPELTRASTTSTQPDTEDTTAASDSQATATSVYLSRYKKAGSSLSNVMPRIQRANRKGSVNGPTSALSAYLSEKGIKAPRHMARWQRRQDAGEAEEGSGEQDGEAAEENAPETPPKTRGSRAAAVAKAAARVDKVLDGAKGLTKNTKKSSKNSGKKNTRKRKKASDETDSDDSDDGDYIPRMSLCGTCGCRVQPGCLVCGKCNRLSSRNTGDTKTKKKRRKKKAVPGSLLDELRGGRVTTLQELCIHVVVKYIDCVEAFGDIAEEARDRICQIVCKHRRLTDETLPLFLTPETSKATFKDCADVSPIGYKMMPTMAPMLTSLDLVHCGQLNSETFAELSDNLPFLNRVTLLGCFKITDETLSDFIESKPGLKTFRVSHSDNVGPGAVGSLVEHCSDLEELELSHCRSIDDELVKSLAVLKNLECLSVEGCELLTNDGLLEPVKSFGKTLKSLNVSGVRLLTDDFVACLAENTGNLQTLTMRELSLITDEHMPALFSKNAKLEDVDITRCTSLGDQGVKPLFTKCTRIARLRLNSLDKLSGETFQELAKLSPDLKELDLSFCREITDELLLEICKRCSHLAKIHVWGCSRITHTVLGKTPPAVSIAGCSRIQ